MSHSQHYLSLSSTLSILCLSLFSILSFYFSFSLSLLFISLPPHCARCPQLSPQHCAMPPTVRSDQTTTHRPLLLPSSRPRSLPPSKAGFLLSQKTHPNLKPFPCHRNLARISSFQFLSQAQMHVLSNFLKSEIF